MWVNTKSKSYKAFVSFLVAIILVFSFEVNKPKAIAPILAYGAWMLGSIVVEEAISMGVRHYTADGKATTKNKTKKVADTIFANIDDYGFDFLKTNPKRKADGSLEMYPSANDRAKIARMIADEFGDVLENDGFRRGDADLSHNGVVVSPEDTSQSSKDAYDLMTTFFDTETRENAGGSGVDVTDFRSVITGNIWLGLMTWDSRTGQTWKTHSYTNNINAGAKNFVVRTRSVQNPTFMTTDAYGDAPTIVAFENYKLIKSLGKSIMYSGGLAVPSTIEQVYPAPPNMSPTYKLPNYDDLSNKPHVIENVYPVSSSDDDSYTWETVNNDYETDNSIVNKFETDADVYLENGNMVTNKYEIEEVNNYYTDSNYPVKSGDVTVIVDNDIIVPPGDGDGDGTTVHNPHVEHVEELNQGMFAIMKNSYDYLGDSLDNALLAMKDVTDDATGLIVYLDTAFDWLPSEWRALFGSAFVLGIFAHFFRR